LLQARYEDGEPISDDHIADELLTLLGSGHETTASSLAWALERLSRHPELCKRLADEADAGGGELRQATIWEVQRTRPVLDGTTRRTKTRIQLGEWVLPEGTNIIISIKLAHASEQDFPDAESFNPDRYLGTASKPVAWIPFGGGVNRCVGAAFANMESDVVLRMLLREFRFKPSDAPGEKAFWRGVATVPAKGARAVVYRRTDKPPVSSDSLFVADHGSV
jgi:cytochrome P450